MTIIEEKLNKLPDNLKDEALDFIEFLIEKKMKNVSGIKRPIGLAKGKIKIKDDFQNPLTDAEMKELGF